MPKQRKVCSKVFPLQQIPTNFSGKRTQEKHIEDAITADQNQDAPVPFD